MLSAPSDSEDDACNRSSCGLHRVHALHMDAPAGNTAAPVLMARPDAVNVVVRSRAAAQSSAGAAGRMHYI